MVFTVLKFSRNKHVAMVQYSLKVIKVAIRYFNGCLLSIVKYVLNSRAKGDDIVLYTGGVIFHRFCIVY